MNMHQNGAAAPTGAGPADANSAFTPFATTVPSMFLSEEEATMNTHANGHTPPNTPPINMAAMGFDSFVQRTAASVEEVTKAAAPASGAAAAGAAVLVAPAEEQQQPTLFIGIGGTGVKVGTQLKLNFAQSRGSVPDRWAFLTFDSADDPVSYSDERTGKVVILDPGGEKIEFEPTSVRGIQHNRDRHPEVYATFGAEAINRIKRAHISHGAAQDRLQGALAGAFNAKLFERKVKQRLHKLVERDRDLANAPEGTTTLRVFLVFSLGGGQGSGFGLIAAAIVNRLLEEMSTLGERGKITGVFLLPDAFHGIETVQMQANTMAFIEEFNALMLGRVTARIEYPGGDPLQVNDAPLSDVYVLGGVDEAGRTLPDVEDVCGLAARLIWLLNSSVVGTQEINAMINQTGVLLNVSDAGYGTYLGTAGHATIRFPARDIVSRCAARYAAAVLRKLVQQTAVAQPQAGGGRAGDPIGFNTVRERLSSNAEGMPHAVRLVTPKALVELPERDIPPKARVMVDNHLQRRVEGDVFQQINQKGAALLSILLQQLGERTDGLVLRGKLHEALAFVVQAQATQEQVLDQLSGEQDRLAQLDDQGQQGLHAAGAVLDKSLEGFLSDLLPSLRRAPLERALQLFVAEANSLAQVRVDRKVVEQSSAVLRKTGEWLRERRRMLESLAGRLELAEKVLEAYADDLGRRSGGRSEILLHDSGLVDHLYQKYAGKVDVDAAMVVAQAHGMQEWLAYKPDQIARAVLEAVTSRYEPILKLSVEDVLALRWNERSMHQWLARLEGLAAAAWNPDRALLQGGGAELARYMVLGVPDATRSLFAGAGTTLVSTNDPERIIALRTVYGGSFDALKPFVQWQRAYNRIAPKVSPHIFRWFQRSEDRTLQVFALGLIYGLIRSQGAWYSYHHADTLRDPVRLAQGLEKSIAAFSQMNEVQAHVDERVQAEMAKDGQAHTAQRISAWINTGASNGGSIDETLVKLRRAAREVLAAIEGQAR